MPTPPTPVITGPASGSTHSGSVTFTFEVQSNPPTVAMAAPTAGANVSAGQPLLLAATASDPDGTVAGVSFSVNGGAAVAATYNAGAARWEATVTAPAAGSHAVTATATDDGGATATTAARTFTTDGVVAAYVSTVNTKRSALALAALAGAEVTALHNFWGRVGNRDGELSGSLHAAFADVFCLRSAYNVGDGAEAVGLKGTVLTRSGTTLPAWGTGGMTFAGGTGVLAAAAGIVTGASALTFYGYATATGTPSATTYLASQFNTGIVGALYLGRNSNGVDTNAGARDSAGTLRTAVATGQWGATRASASAHYSTTTTSVQARLLPAGTTVTTTNAALTGTTAAEPFRIGNSGAGTSGWLGEVTAVAALTADLTSADAIAFDAIAKATLGAGL